MHRHRPLVGLTFLCTLGCATSDHTPVRPTATAAASPALRASPSTGAPSTAATTAPPFSLLGIPGDVFLLVAEHGKATCQRWTVAPGSAGAVQLRHDDDVIDLVVAADTVTISGRSRGDTSVANCGEALATHELHDASHDLDVAGARWFARGEDCNDARAQHRRVAMDLSRCEPDAPLPESVLATTHARLDRMLARGGTMYTDVDGTCNPVRVVASRGTNGRLEGSFISEQRRGRKRSMESYGYQKQPGADEITLLGPSYEETDGDETVSGGMLCGDVTTVDLGRDTALGMYFTRARCRAAHAIEVTNASWLPADPDDATPAGDEPADELATTALPFGGC